MYGLYINLYNIFVSFIIVRGLLVIYIAVNCQINCVYYLYYCFSVQF